MKNSQKFYLFLIMVAACNNTTPTTVTGGCNNLVLFHKGAVVESSSYDAKGKETSKQTATVTDVVQAGGFTESHVKNVMHMPSLGDKTAEVVYKCDGKNLYVDVNSVMQNFKALQNTNAKVSNMGLPLDVSEGQKLPDVVASFTMTMGGKPMEIVTTYKDRTVGAKENITTPAGSFKCYKISSTTDADVQGADEKMKAAMNSMKGKMKAKMIMWYAPDVGIVKTETYSNDALAAYTQVTSIKK